MIVDKTNFQEAKHHLQQVLKNPNCQFISMDLEMTGIKSEEIQYQDDLPFERYQKMRQVAKRYNIIQLGLSVFAKDPQTNKIHANSYTFFSFPMDNKVYTPDVNLQCGSIEFNCKYNMDYNRWIYKGISYFQKEYEQKLYEQIVSEEDKILEESDSLYQKMNEESQEQMTQIQQEIMQWASNPSNKENFIITGKNWFLRKYLMLFIQEHYPMYYAQVTDQNIVIQKTTQKEKDEVLLVLKIKKEKRVDEICGLLRVMQMVWETKLPIIGHNCLYDHLFLYQAFIGPLPHQFDEFKHKLLQNYPQLFDTKIIAQQFFPDLTQKTTLENLQKIVLNNPDIFPKLDIQLPPEMQQYNFESQQEGQQYHEAGFDSYLTGWIYYYFISNPKVDLGKIQNGLLMWGINWSIFTDKEDIRIKDNLVFVVTEKNIKPGKYKKDTSSQTIKTIKSKFSPDVFPTGLSIRNKQGRHFFIELSEEEIQNKKEQFIKQVVSLKPNGFNVQSYADYIMDRKVAFNTEISKYNKDY